MSWLDEQWRRCYFWLNRGRLERELADEMAMHRDLRAEKLRQQGMGCTQASNAAMQRFGNSALLAEDSRTYWGWIWLDRLGRDLTFAKRQLRRHATFTLSATTTLGLGIGSAILVFALLYSVVLHPFAFAAPDELAIVWINDVKRGIREEGAAYPTYLDWRAQTRTFSDLAARGRGGDAILAGPVPERVLIDVVSANFLPMLGVNPVSGRLFTAAEEERGDQVVVISHSLALRRFGSPEAAIAGRITMFERVWHVIGVMPPRFGIPPARQDVWLPARRFPPLERHIDRRSSDFFVAIGRLKRGVTVREAEAELNAIGERLAVAYPVSDPEFAGYNVAVVPLRDQVLGRGLPRTLWMLLASVGLVLLVACVNVANLLLARGVARRPEFAVRVALGAGTRTLFHQQLIESALLSAIGGVLGMAIASGLLRVLPLLTPADLPRFDELAIHPPVIFFAVFICASTTVLFTGVPAWVQSRRDPHAGLRSAATRGVDRRFGRFQTTFLVIEFALAFILVVAAGAFVKSLANIRAVDPGFEARNTLLIPTDLHGSDPSLLYTDLLARLVAIPGVESAGAIGDLFIERNPDDVVTVQGRATRSNEQVTVDGVSPTFLQAIGARLQEGRLLTEADYQYERPKVVVVNLTFAVGGLWT